MAGSLGILPLLPLAAAAIATGLGIGWWWDKSETDYEEFKKQLKSPAAPPAPPAPETREQMTSWTVDDLRRQWERLRLEAGTQAIPDTPDTAPKPADDSLLWAALGLAGVSLFLLARR
jgi:hypothetical protein